MHRFTTLVYKTACIGFGVALLSVPAAHAGVVFATGFETTDTPPYTVGALTGQNGWLQFNNALASVTNGMAESGTQSVFVNGNTSNLQAGPYHADAPGGPLIELQADLFIASGIENDWQFAATGPNLTGYIGGIDLVPQNNVGGTVDNIDLISGAFPVVGTFNLNTWNHVDFLFNMNTQTYNFALNGVNLATNAPFCGTNGACTGANVPVYADSFFDVFGNVNSTDSGFMDNINLSTVPEPGTLLLLAPGLALILRRKLARG